MPTKYTEEKRQERLKLLEAKITIAKKEGTKDEVKKYQNLLRKQRCVWKV